MYNSIANTKNLEKFETWNEIPESLKTRNQWRQLNRKLKSKPKASGYIVYKGNPAKLYPESQTNAFKEIDHKRKTFCEWILDLAKHDTYIEKKAKWFQRNPERFDQPITWKDITSHLNGSRTLGVLANNLTRLVVIDYDWHGKDLEGYFKGLKRLLSHFPTLIVQASVPFNGVHLICVLSEPTTVKNAIEGTREELEKIGLENIEIYPNQSHGCRVPLAKDRVIYLDKPVYQHKNRVCQFVDFVQGGQKGQMTPKQVLAHLKELAEAVEANSSTLPRAVAFAPEAERQSAARKHTKKRSYDPIFKHYRKFRSNLIRYFQAKDVPEGHINKAIVAGVKAAWAEGLSESQAAQTTLDYCLTLPNNVSSRVSKPKELASYIQRAAQQAYATLEGPQTEADKQSVYELERTRAAWKKSGFKFSDQATWKQAKKRSTFYDPILNKTLVAYLQPIMKCQANEIPPIVNEALQLVQTKEKEENGISIKYWRQFFTDQGLAMGFKEKANQIVQAFIELGLIQIQVKHHFNPGLKNGRATRYSVAEKHTKKRSTYYDPILTEAPKERSTYYDSLLNLPKSNHLLPISRQRDHQSNQTVEPMEIQKGNEQPTGVQTAESSYQSSQGQLGQKHANPFFALALVPNSPEKAPDCPINQI